MKLFFIILLCFNYLIANEIDLDSNLKQISLKDKTTLEDINNLNKKYFNKYFEYFNKKKITYFRYDIQDKQKDLHNALILCELIFKEKFKANVYSLFEYKDNNIYLEYNSCKKDYLIVTNANKKIIIELKYIETFLTNDDDVIKIVDFKN